MGYKIAEIDENENTELKAYQPYGAALQLWKCKDYVIIMAGPAETGKSLGCLHKLDALAWKYPGSQLAMIRKKYTDMPGSCVHTYEQRVLGAWNEEKGEFDGDKTPVKKYGGEKPQFYDYPNGSRLWVGGLDNPGKTLSTERDFVYVNQAEEIERSDYEFLQRATTGRANNAPYTQIILDCNPGPPFHWIKKMEGTDECTWFNSRHQDNPTLYNPKTGELTERGKRTMSILKNLTGVRLQRLYYGKWVSAEGQIYEEFLRSTHVTTLDKLHYYKNSEIDHTYLNMVVAGVDWGYTNPGCIGVWAVDRDNRMVEIEEVYQSQRTIEWWIDRAIQLRNKYRINTFVCDPSEPAYIEGFTKAGLVAVKGFNDVRPGIDAVKDRLKVQKDGRPRIQFVEDALKVKDQELVENKKPIGSLEEIDGYIWDDKKIKEQPLKENDHAMDQIRYAVCYVDSVGSRLKKPGVWGSDNKQQ